MGNRECPPGIFSTANGKYAYREARHWVRPIFREDYKDDVEHMARRIRQEFPQECKPMTAPDAGQVEHYFDAVDIQMQTRAFLYEVLIRIVWINFEEALARVHEYVHHVLLDRVRYKGLTVDDSEVHVFTEEERGLVGYDNTLPAALSILKHLKFPSAFNGANLCSTIETQTVVGTDDSLDTTAASIETLVSDPSQPSDGENTTSSAPAAMQTPHRPRGGEIKESSQAEQDENASDHSVSNLPLSKATHPVQGQPNMSPNSSRQTICLEPGQPDEHTLPTTTPMSLSTHSPALVLEKASSELKARSHYQPLTATCRECPSDSRANLRDGFFVSNQSTQHPSNYFRQDLKGCRQFKETRPPTKKASNGIRRKSIAMKPHSQLPQSFHAESVPVIVLPSQPIPKEPCGPLIPDRISSVGFSTTFAGNHHQRTLLVDSASPHDSSLIPYYPRPESFRARSEVGDGRHQDVIINGISLDTRALSYSFRPGILEDLEGEKASVNQRAGPFLVGYKGDRMPQYSTINQGLGLRSSCAPESPMSFMDFHDVVRCDPQTPALFKENHMFPSQDKYRQFNRQTQSHSRRGCRNLVQDRLLDRPFHRQSFSKDQSFSQGSAQSRNDCVLYVSGFPEHLDAKALWQMLSPVHGLKWVAPIKKAQNERGRLYTNIVFHEPLFAAEALDLLPRTMFAAMNGRFLNVRRSGSEQARPTQYWDPNTSTRSRYPIHPVRRSSESAFPAYSQATHPYHSPGHQNRLPASMSYEKPRTHEFVAQYHQVNSQFNGNNDHLFRSEAEKASDRDLQDNCAKEMLISATSEMTLDSVAVQPHSTYSYDQPSGYQKALDGRSTASTGSPVKRVKRKGPNSPSIGRIKAKDSTEVPSKELAKDQSETPEEESQELAAEALKIEAAQPGLINLPLEGPPLEAGVEAKEALPDGPEALQPAKQVAQPRKANFATQLLHSKVRHSTEKVKTPTKQCPLQLSQAHLSPQETVEGCERSVPFLFLPETPQKDLMQEENTLLQPTGLKAPAEDADTPEQDFVTNEVAIHQDSNANTSRKIPFSTKEQQLAAEASQRQFAAVLVQTQTKSNNSKVKGKGQRPSMALKAADHQSIVKSFISEPAGDNKRHSKVARVAKHPQRPATEMPFHESLPASTTEAQHSCPIDIGPVPCADKGFSSSPNEDFSSRSPRGTPSVDGELRVTKPSLPMASLTTCLYKQDLVNIEGHDTHTTSNSTFKEYNNHEMPPAEIPNTNDSHEKLVITNVQPDVLPRPRRASFNGQPSHLSSEVVDLAHVSPLPIEKAKSEEYTSNRSYASFEKSAFGEQQTNKSVGSCLATPKYMLSIEAMRVSHETHGQGLDESHRGHKKGSTNPAKELTKSISRSENTILSEQAEAAASETSRRSPDRPLRVPVPPRSSSIVKSPTSSPILTRKKKQKKFFLTSEEQQGMNVSKEIVTSERGKLPEADLMLIAQGGSSIEQEMGIVTDASGHNSKPPDCSQSLSHPADMIKSSPKTEFADTESTLTCSTLFITPPVTPSPHDPSSSENTPLAPLAVVNNLPGTLKESSSMKSNNRKKNRPGKKKSKGVRTLPLDYNVPISTLLNAGSGPTNPEISLHDCVVHCSLEDSVLEREELPRAKQQTTEDDKWRNRHGDEIEDLKSPPQLAIKDHAEESSTDDLDVMQPIDFDQANVTAEDQDACEIRKGLPISDITNAPVLQIARDLRYPSAARILSRVIADGSRQILGENGFNNSICAGELRPRHSIAAMKRIQDLCDHESQTQDSLRLEPPFHIIDHSNPKMDKVPGVTDSAKKYMDDPHKGRTGHIHSMEKQGCLESKGIEYAAALDLELQSIIREAVQMTLPFPSDKKDLEKEIFYTLESVRVKRILKVTDFCEVSPLNFGHDRDRRWISEWCDEVAQWIHYDVPRMTELQKKDIEKWEIINPSMEKNLMALGFTTLEIHQCVLNQEPKILEITRISAPREHEPKDSRSRPRSAYENSDIKSSFPHQVLSHPERKPQTKIHPTASAIDYESESDSFEIQSCKIEHVESGSPPAIDIGGDDEVKELISSDKLGHQQTLKMGSKAIAGLKSKLMKPVTADNEELDEVDATCKSKLEKVAQPTQEKGVDFPLEEKKAKPPKDHCGSSSLSGDKIIDIGLAESLKWKTVADQLSIAAAIKQNEEDLQGMSLARKYKKAGQGELQTLGLVSSPLKMTTSLSSTLSEPLRDSPKPEIVAPLTMRSSAMQQSLTSMTSVPFPTPDASLSQETSLEPQEPLTVRPSYATALQSPIATTESSSQSLCTPKPTYAIVLQASDSRCKEPTDTDAWALPGEEAWGVAANNVGGASQS